MLGIKRMFAGAPIPDVRDLLKDGHFRRSSGFHELNNIHLKAITCSSHRQSYRPRGFTDALPEIDVSEPKTFFFNVTGTFLWIKYGYHLL
jgi:hypothetical protein